MANQPDIIPMAWAANNSTADSIPETTSESGKASWDQGFPVETSLPLSQGGVPPKYGDFNGILKILSQFALFAQAGGQYAWNNTLAYGVGSIVLGTDGNLYRAAQESTAVNPVGDASGKWERVVSQSDLAAISATATQAAAAANTAQQTAESAQNAVTTLNGNVVKLSGNQTIAGTKTFSSQISGTITSAGTITSTLPVSKGGTGATTVAGAKTALGIGNVTNGGISGTGNIVLKRAAGTVGSPFNGSIWIYVRDSTDETNFAQQGWWTNSAGHSNIQLYVRRNAKDATQWSVNFGVVSENAPHFAPEGTSGKIRLGDAANSGVRWAQLYAATATISTSDERKKGNISDVPDEVLDAWADVHWCQFQWKESIAEKGEDHARIHNGMIAQRIQAVFEAHGLDVSKYAFFCHDSWEGHPAEYIELAEVDAEGNPTGKTKQQKVRDAVEAGDEYSLRYEDALCIEAAYQRRRADRMVARISEMERRLNEMESALASLIAPVGDETYAGSDEGGAQA